MLVARTVCGTLAIRQEVHKMQFVAVLKFAPNVEETDAHAGTTEWENMMTELLESLVQQTQDLIVPRVVLVEYE